MYTVSLIYLERGLYFENKLLSLSFNDSSLIHCSPDIIAIKTFNVFTIAN